MLVVTVKSTKLIAAYPQPKDFDAFDEVYQKDHVPMAIANLAGKTKIFATKLLAPPQGKPQFYCIAEVHFPSIEALQRCAESDGKETLVHAAKMSSGGPPGVMIAEEDTFTF